MRKYRIILPTALTITLTLAACGGRDQSTATTETTAAAADTTAAPRTTAAASTTDTSVSLDSAPSGMPPGGAGGGAVAPSAAAETLAAEVASKFTQTTYDDAETGLSVPYNIFFPADYDASTQYPMVLYIADSSLVGQDVTAPLSQYGALIWASEAEQAKHASIVVVPEFPEVILDDHDSFTTTEYVELTGRLVAAVQNEYSVDPSRVYGTGQSMGAMTVMYLAAHYPDLFAAELIVSGQWDPTTLTRLAGETFTYTAAGGDERASGGQTDVQAILDDAGVAYASGTEWDATWSEEEFAAAAAELYAAGNSANFVNFAIGTVLEAMGTASSSGAGGSEHMSSFEPAYKISALRDWLFQQSAS